MFYFINFDNNIIKTDGGYCLLIYTCDTSSHSMIDSVYYH